MRKVLSVLLTGAALVLVGSASGSAPGTDVRLSNDCHPGACGAGYVSDYTLVTGIPYTDPTLAECTRSHGRQNEPAVAVDPRDTRVLLGSSNDYCGVYNRTASDGTPLALGPIWLGYYRSTDSGQSFVSSLVPGYPDDTSPYAALSQARTATAGDPVIAWDRHGRAFFGSESSGDPAGSKKTFGDVFVARYRNPGGPDSPNTTADGKEYNGTTVLQRGSSAPNLLGVFNDKTAIEADRTGGPCDGNVYFAWSRFTGNGGVNIYFARSTDHGVTFSNPQKLTASIHDVQFPEISVTGNGHVYVTFRQFASKKGHEPDAIQYVKSVDCGQTFSSRQTIVQFTPYDAQDVAGPAATPPQSAPDDPAAAESGDAQGGLARNCGDFANACQSGYTFFRRDTQARSTADQLDKAHEWIYIVYDPTKPGTETPTGTTYGSIQPGTGSQSAISFVRLDGATGAHTAPRLLDNQPTGHQLFPDISADGGVLHALWWDTRNDPCYSPMRPVGNCADRTTVPALDVFATSSHDNGGSWSPAVRVTDVTTNGNYEQFSNRTVPFGGDYLWVTSQGDFSYGAWTDWRNTVAGGDPREAGDGDGDSADVRQCRSESNGTFSSDLCPRAGGLDQDIYGDTTP
ncbi:MAG: hypothetical protein ABR569_02720 [Gaiellaceae bacterium]